MNDRIREWSEYFGTHCHLPAAAIRDLFDEIQRLTAEFDTCEKLLDETRHDLYESYAEIERLRAVVDAAQAYIDARHSKLPDESLPTFPEPAPHEFVLLVQALAALEEK